LRPLSEDALSWDALVRPGRKMRTGERILFDDDVEAEILSRGEFGERTIRFHTNEPIYELLQRIGHVPLPPYIKDRIGRKTAIATRPFLLARPAPPRLRPPASISRPPFSNSAGMPGPTSRT